MRLDPKALDRELAELRESLQGMLTLADEGREERINQAKADFRSFCRTYFPHYILTSCSGFHDWIFQSAPGWGPGLRLAVAAPRGNAKTTYLARLYVLWRLCRRDAKFVVIIQDTTDGANQSVELIKVELEENPRLAQDFPEVVGQGRTWKTGEIVTRSNAKVKAYGSGKRLRGANYMNSRPDLIVCDDLENDENVQSKDQRDKLENWFKKAVLKLGPPDGSAQVIVIGTVLLHDAVLLRISKRPDFTFHRFKALVAYPRRMDLWDEWERLYKITPQDAEAYYRQNRPAMDEGAAVLWPEVQPLYVLMQERANDRAAFSTELQNEALDPDSQIFAPEIFHFYVALPPLALTVGGVDPALGKARGDFTAIVILGRDANRRLYVVEADIARYSPLQCIRRLIHWQRIHGCVRWGFEDVAFQEFFKEVAIQESIKAETPLPAVGIKPKASKEIRIESLQPHIQNGVIQFSAGHGLLLDQFHEYPKGAHDDGPDALHMAFSLAYSAAPIEFKTTGSGLGARLKSWIGRGF